MHCKICTVWKRLQRPKTADNLTQKNIYRTRRDLHKKSKQLQHLRRLGKRHEAYDCISWARTKRQINRIYNGINTSLLLLHYWGRTWVDLYKRTKQTVPLHWCHNHQFAPLHWCCDERPHSGTVPYNIPWMEQIGTHLTKKGNIQWSFMQSPRKKNGIHLKMLAAALA